MNGWLVYDQLSLREAWDTLATLFTRTSSAKLQLLENELMAVSQQDMSVSQNFSKVKALCDEISKLDPENQNL